MTCTGAILIGGKSSRFGSPKHDLILPGGKTMMAHVRETLSAVCHQIVLVDAIGTTRVSDVKTITDFRLDAGPLSAIEALLASGMDTHYLVCPCDVPLVTAEMLRLLMSSRKALATVFHVEGRKEIEPLPARIRADALPVVRRLLHAQQRSVGQFIQEIMPQVIMITAPQAMPLHNVNTKVDFEEAVRLMTPHSRGTTRS